MGRAAARPFGQARALGRGRRAANLDQRIDHACSGRAGSRRFPSAVLARPRDGVSLYGPTRTRVRLFGPGRQRGGKSLVLEGLTHGLGASRLHRDHLPVRSGGRFGRLRRVPRVGRGRRGRWRRRPAAWPGPAAWWAEACESGGGGVAAAGSGAGGAAAAAAGDEG